MHEASSYSRFCRPPYNAHPCLTIHVPYQSYIQFESTTQALSAISKRVDKFSGLAEKLGSIEEAQEALLAEVQQNVKDVTAALESRCDKVNKELLSYQDSQADIAREQGTAQCEMIAESISRCEKLAAQINEGKKNGGITSEEAFSLKKEMVNFAALSSAGEGILKKFAACLRCDPRNYGALKDSQSDLTNKLRELEVQKSPLWDALEQFDSGIADSIDLIVAIQTGLSGHDEALKKIEEDVMLKASGEDVAGLEANARQLAEDAIKIDGEMKRVEGEMNSLSSRNADLSSKVYEMMENMDSIVDEEKLKESVKKMLDIYLKQLEAKATGDTELFHRLQKELEDTGGQVEKLFKTKADVGDVTAKAEKNELDQTSATLQQLQVFVKQFEKELETVRVGQAGDLDKLRRHMEKKLMGGIVERKVAQSDEAIALTHKKAELCLSCNRPLGKAVNLNSSATYYGPKDDSTGQIYGRKTSLFVGGVGRARASMLLKLERDKQWAVSKAALPKSKSKSIYAGGYGGANGVGDPSFAEELGGNTIPEPSEEVKVRRTLAKLEIDHDEGSPSILSPAKGGAAGKKVAKDWLKVTSKGVTLTVDSSASKEVSSEALRRDARRTVLSGGVGSLLHDSGVSNGGRKIGKSQSKGKHQKTSGLPLVVTPTNKHKKGEI